MQISLPAPPRGGIAPAPPVAPHETITPRRPAPNWSTIFIALCCGLFLIGVSLRLNGSSSGIWARELGTPDEPTGLLAGQSRLTRSDEWLVWTPAALAQLHHQPPMPVANPAIGAGVAPLLMSVPVRHYSMLFRPQFWGFFVFDEERGFAWFWNTKIFSLLISLFLLFRILTKGRIALAVCGSIAVSYSSYVQWFFSCPPMLPEMLASWALMLVAGKLCFDPVPVWKKTVAGIVLLGSTINFALCCYPPFQLPLLYLALTLFAVFLWERRNKSSHGGLVWMAATLLIALAVLWPTYVQCRSTLEIIAHTSYPGARRGSGGTLSIAYLLSGFLNFFDGNRLHPAMFSNTTEASNFFPIWLAAIAGVSWKLWRSRRTGSAGASIISMPLCIGLIGYVLVFVCYSVIGFPEWLSRITALNFVPETRLRLTIGMAGLMLAFVSLATDGRALVRGWGRIVVPIAIAGVAFSYILFIRGENTAYLTPGYVALLIGATTLLGSLYFCTRGIVFAGSLAAALLLNNFLVNPISEGLPVFLRSPAAQHIATIHKSNPTASWAVYGRGLRAQLVMSSGAHVLNGIKSVPDLPSLSRLDPAQTSRDIYNRYAFVVMGLPLAEGGAASFELQGTDWYLLRVSPFDNAMREANLKYVIFPRSLAPDEMGNMKLIDALPANLIWIYELDQSAPST